MWEGEEDPAYVTYFFQLDPTAQWCHYIMDHKGIHPLLSPDPSKSFGFPVPLSTHEPLKGIPYYLRPNMEAMVEM